MTQADADDGSKPAKGRGPRWLAAGITAAVIAALGCAAWLRDRPADVPVPQAQRQALRCGFSAGSTRSYQLAMDASSRVNPKALVPIQGGAPPPALGEEHRVALGGVLHMRVVEASPQLSTLVFRFDAEYSSDGPVGDRQREELSHPIWARVDPLCEFVQLAFGEADAVAPTVQNQLRGLLQSAQVVLAKDPHADEWKHLEHSLSGRYLASYEREADAERRVRKRKVSYLEVNGPQVRGSVAGAPDDTVMSARVRHSDILAELAADGAWLKTFGAKERIVFFADGSMLTDVRTTLALDAIEPVPAATANLTAPQAGWFAASAAPAYADPVLAPPPDMYLAMTIDEAVSRAMALITGKPPRHAEAGREIAYLLRAQPGRTEELLQAVRSDRIDPALHSAVFFGLEQAGTPEARQALIDCLADPGLQPENRMRAAVALPDIREPNTETLDALDALARDGAQLSDPSREQQLQNAATFALGTLEHNRRDADPALARQARERIREHLSQAGSDVVEVTAALDAIHNSGNPELLALVEPHLRSSEVLVRQHAYEAIERMPPDATARLFAELIEAEPEDRQRAALAVAYTEQAQNARSAPPETVWRAAAARLGREPNPMVRASLVHLIGAAAAEQDGAVEVLAQQYAQESHPSMLQAIGKYVPADRLPRP